MRAISRLFVGLAAVLLTFAFMAVSVDTTFLSSKAWLVAADKADVYVRLSQSLPNVIAPGTTAADIQSRAVAATVVTPSALRAELKDYLPNVEAYVRGSGPAPGPPLKNLIDQGKQMSGQAGLVASSSDQASSKPSPVISGLGWTLAHEWWWLALGLIAGLLAWLTAPVGKRWWRLVQIAIGTAIGLGLWLILLMLIPGPLTSSLSGNQQLAPLAPILSAWLRALVGAGGAQVRLALIACAVIAALALTLQLFGHRFQRHHETPKHPSSNLPVDRRP